MPGIWFGKISNNSYFNILFKTTQGDYAADDDVSPYSKGKHLVDTLVLA